MPNTNPSDLDREALVKHMVSRFLGWKLPDNFNPDAGISFKRDYNENIPWPMKHEPVGTNLFDAVQAEAMVRFIIDGADLPRASGVPEADAVAWQWRWRYLTPTVGRWSEWKNGQRTAPIGAGFETEERALYASPRPFAAPSGEAEPIGWLVGNGHKRQFYITEEEARQSLSVVINGVFVRPVYEAPPCPIPSESKDAGSAEGQEMTRQEQEWALENAWSDGDPRAAPFETLDLLHRDGFSITRTAPSGAKPGEEK